MHAPDAPRWRAILLLSRDINAAEYEIVWRHVQTALGGTADEQAKDACRFSYAPMVHPGHAHEFEFRELAGEPVDVDAILKDAPMGGPSFEAPAIEVCASDGFELTPERRKALQAFAARWPKDGERNEARMALTGALLRVISKSAAVEIISELYRHLGEDKREDAERTVRKTSSKLEAGEKVTGWPKLKEHVDPAAVDALRGALGFQVLPEVTESETQW